MGTQEACSTRDQDTFSHRPSMEFTLPAATNCQNVSRLVFLRGIFPRALL
jgi:hypothetical protein